MTDEGSGTGPRPAPAWVRRIAEAAERIAAEPSDSASPWAVPAGAAVRQSAVLVLLGEADGVPDVLLTERAHDMRSHAGQPAFPGGGLEEGDDGVVGAALREAQEETGLDPAGVDVLGCLPPLYLAPGGFVVTPVIAWWRVPSPVSVVDPLEVASVHRVPISELVDPANRSSVRHPSGYVGPGFHVRGLLVWGFTGGLLDRVLALGGLERDWDRTRVEDLPAEALRLAEQARGSVA